jgi:hypothetical protein
MQTQWQLPFRAITPPVGGANSLRPGEMQTSFKTKREPSPGGVTAYMPETAPRSPLTSSSSATGRQLPGLRLAEVVEQIARVGRHAELAQSPVDDGNRRSYLDFIPIV